MPDASKSAEMESWRNISAMDDLVHDILGTDTHVIVSAVSGNAGAGGVALALAADEVLVRRGVALNPHYKGMALFGSEYWTYLFPRRVGPSTALERYRQEELTQMRRDFAGVAYRRTRQAFVHKIPGDAPAHPAAVGPVIRRRLAKAS